MLQLFGGPFDGLIIEEQFPDILVPMSDQVHGARYTFVDKDNKYIYVGIINQNELVVDACKYCAEGKILNPNWHPNDPPELKFIDCPVCQKQ